MSALDELLDGCHPEDVDEERRELATLRANQLPAAVVDAVRVYQETVRAFARVECGLDTLTISRMDMLRAIEADAKGRG